MWSRMPICIVANHLTLYRPQGAQPLLSWKHNTTLNPHSLATNKTKTEDIKKRHIMATKSVSS